MPRSRQGVVWRRRPGRSPGSRPEPDPISDDPAAVCVEARALVEGRVVDDLWTEDQPIPAWVWLNALAHRPVAELGELVGVACDRSGGRWPDAVIDIAWYFSRIPGDRTAQIQAEVFVPAELEALAGRSPPDGPGRLVRAVRRRLISDSHRAGPNRTERCDRSEMEPNPARGHLDRP